MYWEEILSVIYDEGLGVCFLCFFDWLFVYGIFESP